MRWFLSFIPNVRHLISVLRKKADFFFILAKRYILFNLFLITNMTNNLFVKVFFTLLILCPAFSKAQIVGADLFMQGDYVEIGVGAGGWYGSAAAGPTGFHGRTPGPQVGFVSDPDKDGWNVGVPNYCGDYFVPGYPQEGWDIQIGSLWAKAWLGTGLSGGITGSNVSYTSTATDVKGVWEGSVSGLFIRQTTILKKNKVYFLIKVTLKNTTSSDINDIYYDRTLDPDNTSTMGPTGSVPGIVTSSYATTENTIEFKLPNAKSRSLVSAIGKLTVVKPTAPDTVDYPVYLGIGSKDCRARPYILSSGLNPGTADSPARLYRNDKTLTHLYDSGQSNFTDAATGLIFNIQKLKPGDSTSFFMAYVLSTADLDSAFADMAPQWEYGGRKYESGDTVKLCRDKAAPDEIKSLNIFGGDDYTWTWSARPGLKNSTGTINEIRLTNTPVTYVAKPSEGFGCVDSMVLTIMPYINPDPPTVVSPLEYCRFKAAPALTATGMAGATLRYFTVPTGGTSSAKIVPNTNTAGTYTFYVSQLNGICESSRTPITIIVRPIPTIDSFSFSHPTTCGGKDGWIRFKADEANMTYTVDYDKDGLAQPSLTLTSDANGFIRIIDLQRASYSAFKITNKYGCVSNTYFGPIELDGPHATPPVVKNNGPLCVGDLAMLMTAPKDSTTYLWKGPDGFTSTDPNPTFTTNPKSGGVYTLVTTKNSCLSDPATTTLVIFPDPKNPELNDISICEGQDIFAEVLLESNTTYTWSGGGDGYLESSGISASLKREKAKVNYAGQYIFEAVNEIGCRTNDTINVTVDTLVQMTVSNDTLMCARDVITLYAIPNVGTVTWTPSTGLSDSTSFSPSVSPNQTITYTVTAKSRQGVCPPVTDKVKVEVLAAPSVTGYDTLVRMNIPYKIMPKYGQEVVNWQWVPADSLSCSNCPYPTFSSSKDHIYLVYVSDKYGCTNVDTMVMRVFCDGANVTMPNAFTPNGDGTNDVFYVRGTGMSVKSFRIFNRLGQEIFARENFMPNDPSFGWDGTYRGQEISDAAGFVYMIEVVCFNSKNEPILIKGNVLMIK